MADTSFIDNNSRTIAEKDFLILKSTHPTAKITSRGRTAYVVLSSQKDKSPSFDIEEALQIYTNWQTSENRGFQNTQWFEINISPCQ